jgi:hypothetical protein
MSLQFLEKETVIVGGFVTFVAGGLIESFAQRTFSDLAPSPLHPPQIAKPE